MDIKVEKIKVTETIEVEIDQYTINGVVVTEEFCINNDIQKLQKGNGEKLRENIWEVKHFDKTVDYYYNDDEFEKYFNTLEGIKKEIPEITKNFMEDVIEGYGRFSILASNKNKHIFQVGMGDWFDLTTEEMKQFAKFLNDTAEKIDNDPQLNNK